MLVITLEVTVLNLFRVVLISAVLNIFLPITSLMYEILCMIIVLILI